MPKFEDLVLSHHLTNLGKVFDRIVSKNPDTAKKILNSKISEDSDFVQFDFSPFFKNPKFPNPSDPETFSSMQMLYADQDDLGPML